MKKYNKIETYEQFVDYILKRLGAPVINIELADEQIKDRITDALQLYLEEHLDSVREYWFLWKITESDVRAGYIQMPFDILDVTEVIRPNSSSDYDIDIPQDPEYYMMYQWWQYGMTNSSLISYELTMQQLGLMKQLLNAQVQYSWSPQDKKLVLYDKFKSNSVVGIRANKILDPETNNSIWDSRWLKSYATALCGIQWATNLSKFGNIPSSGGITIDAVSLLQRYTEEKQRLKDEFLYGCTEPPMMYIC